MKNELLPSHPLELSEKNYQLNQDKMNFSTLRNIQALFAPLKLQTEFKAGQQVKPLPFPPSSTLSLDILRGNDETIWRRQWQPTPVLLPGESHGQRSLVGCSPWGREESETTERLHFHFSLSCIGEGNGNPLQCSCLENPRDGGAWWAAVYGVAQSRTRLK